MLERPAGLSINLMKTQPPVQLSDIDTAFPRDDSKSVRLFFEDGGVEHVTTNYSEKGFRLEFLGKLVERCFYGRRNEFTKTSRITKIEFY